MLATAARPCVQYVSSNYYCILSNQTAVRLFRARSALYWARYHIKPTVTTDCSNLHFQSHRRYLSRPIPNRVSWRFSNLMTRVSPPLLSSTCGALYRVLWFLCAGRGGRQQQQHHQAGTAPTVSSPSGEEASRLSADSLAMDPSRLTDAVANFAMMMPNAPGAFTELDAVLQQQPHGLTTGTRRRQRTSSESSCCECKTKSGHIDIENAEQWIQVSTSSCTKYNVAENVDGTWIEIGYSVLKFVSRII